MKDHFDLAKVIVIQGRWQEFEGLGIETLERQRRLLGEDHPDTLASLNNLHSFYYRQGRYDEAAPIASEVLTGTGRALGENHPDTLRSVHNLASAYESSVSYDEAEALLPLKVIESRRQVLGDQHPLTARSLVLLRHGIYRPAAVRRSRICDSGGV